MSQPIAVVKFLPNFGQHLAVLRFSFGPSKSDDQLSLFLRGFGLIPARGLTLRSQSEIVEVTVVTKRERKK